MTKRLEVAIAWVGLVALLVLHLDFWRGPRTDLWFGFVPEEIGYRVVWMLAAWVYLMFFTARIWRGEE